MNIHKIKEMYDLARDVQLDMNTNVSIHHIQSREEAQDIAKAVHAMIGGVIKPNKVEDEDGTCRWFNIEVEYGYCYRFTVSVFYQLSEAEKEMYQPRVTV